MKKIISLLLPMLILSIGSTTAQSDLATQAKQQIIAKIDLPTEIIIASPLLIDSLRIDDVTLAITIKQNGRAKLASTKFTKPSIESINFLFLDAIKSIKLPKQNMQTEISMSFKLHLEDLKSDTLPPRLKHSAQQVTMSNFWKHYPVVTTPHVPVAEYAATNSKASYSTAGKNKIDGKTTYRKSLPPWSYMQRTSPTVGLPRYKVSIIDDRE